MVWYHRRGRRTAEQRLLETQIMTCRVKEKKRDSDVNQLENECKTPEADSPIFLAKEPILSATCASDINLKYYVEPEDKNRWDFFTSF